jgi:hypothetical protein
MSTKTPEIVDVRVIQECGDEPMAFLWRGRLYVVREVLGRWRDAPSEAQVFRVEASTGRAFGEGIFDLRRDGDEWTLTIERND